VASRSASPLSALIGVADAVAQSPDRGVALETLTAGLTRALGARICVCERVARGWALVGQSRGGVGVSIDDLHRAVESAASGRTAKVDLSAVGEGIWTFMSLAQPGGPAIVVLIAGDWTGDAQLEPSAVMLSLALRSVRERERYRKTERQLVSGYRMARRLSRLGGVDEVSQRVVDQVAQAFAAERVALALYHPEEDRLAIAATAGYSMGDVKDVRIEPGSWVIGHVYASARPVVVPDIRQVQAMPAARRRYRTFSFAAVPLVAGGETLGVLTATDKRDDSPFDRRDAAALRSLSASATLALMAARSDSEIDRLAHAATVDALTGLFNRPYLDNRLLQEIERARRASSRLAVLMADIDDFKAVNDTYGHQTGDAVLRAVGAIFRSSVRVFDVCARYGGDEFAIVMPSSDYSNATACAERIRRRVAEHSARDDGAHALPHLSVSVGVAVTESGDSPADVLHRADRCLYQAKVEGKNRVRVHQAAPTNIRPIPIIGRRLKELP
jgi:diguanylate cyclase (GGDEF)-like protein